MTYYVTHMSLLFPTKHAVPTEVLLVFLPAPVSSVWSNKATSGLGTKKKRFNGKEVWHINLNKSLAYCGHVLDPIYLSGGLITGLVQTYNAEKGSIL